MPNEEQKISFCCEGCDCGCTEHHNLHPCETLVNLFREKPYQGADPSKAKMLFVGIDANYDEQFKEGNPFLRCIEKYHKDGVLFWKKHGKHHPFLLDKYPFLPNAGGVPYHRNFSEIGFKPEHASQISFIELFHLPTSESGELEACQLCKKHLGKITNWIVNGSNKHVFLSNEVIKLMKKSELLNGKLNPHSSNYYDNENKILKIIHRPNERNIKIYKHAHFSCYGIHQKRLEAEAKLIRKLIDE